MNIGETLARARREADLTVTQVSRRTRIRETVIRAIERNDFSLCGGNFYARGHIRGIAQAIGIDGEPLVTEYDDTHGGSPAAQPATYAFEPATPVGAERRTPNWSAAMAIALVLVLAYGVVRIAGGGESQSVGTAGAELDAPPPPPPSPAQPAPSTLRPDPTPSTKAPPKEVVVRIRAKEESWVNVRNEKGRKLFSGVIQADSTMEWTAKKRVRLIIGNPGAVVLTVNDKKLGTPPSGRIAYLNYGRGEARAFRSD